MKKITLLLIAFGAMTTVFAQQQHGKSNRFSPDEQYSASRNRNIADNHFKAGNFYSEKQRIEDLKRISRDFDEQIKSVRNNRYLKPSEKYRLAAKLERQKEQHVHEINGRFGEGRNNHNDGFADNHPGRY